MSNFKRISFRELPLPPDVDQEKRGSAKENSVAHAMIGLNRGSSSQSHHIHTVKPRISARGAYFNLRGGAYCKFWPIRERLFEGRREFEDLRYISLYFFYAMHISISSLFLLQ